MYIHWRDLRIVYSPVDTESPPVSTWRRYNASSHPPASRNTTRLECTVVGRSKTHPGRRVEHHHVATNERRGVATYPVPTTIPTRYTSPVVPRSTPNVAGVSNHHTPLRWVVVVETVVRSVVRPEHKLVPQWVRSPVPAWWV